MAYYGKRSKKSGNSYRRSGVTKRRGGRKSYSRKTGGRSSGNSRQHTIRIVVEQSGVNTSRTPDTAFLTEAPVKKKSKF